MPDSNRSSDEQERRHHVGPVVGPAGSGAARAGAVRLRVTTLDN
ncbi:hypothetical protein ACIQXA_16325 [Streptomyces massasporeus]